MTNVHPGQNGHPGQNRRKVQDGKEAKTLSLDETMETILTECERVANKTRFQRGPIDESELYSFLVVEVYKQIADKPDFHNIKGIRSTINLYVRNFFKTQARFNDQLPFTYFENRSAFKMKNHPKAICFEETKRAMDHKIPLTDLVILSDQLEGFRQTLSERENQILDLVVAGHGTNDICEMLNISINTPRNVMKKIKEKALQYGL